MGQDAPKLEPVSEVWGDIYPVRGSEYYELKKIQSKVTHKCFIRYREVFSGINSNWFLECEGKTFDVDSAVDVDYEHKMFEIRCYERINKEGYDVKVPPEPEPTPTDEEDEEEEGT